MQNPTGSPDCPITRTFGRAAWSLSLRLSSVRSRVNSAGTISSCASRQASYQILASRSISSSSAFLTFIGNTSPVRVVAVGASAEIFLYELRIKMHIDLDQRRLADALETVDLARLDDKNVTCSRFEFLAVYGVSSTAFPDE